MMKNDLISDIDMVSSQLGLWVYDENDLIS